MVRSWLSGYAQLGSGVECLAVPVTFPANGLPTVQSITRSELSELPCRSCEISLHERATKNGAYARLPNPRLAVEIERDFTSSPAIPLRRTWAKLLELRGTSRLGLHRNQVHRSPSSNTIMYFIMLEKGTFLET